MHKPVLCCLLMEKLVFFLFRFHVASSRSRHFESSSSLALCPLQLLLSLDTLPAEIIHLLLPAKLYTTTQLLHILLEFYSSFTCVFVLFYGPLVQYLNILAALTINFPKDIIKIISMFSCLRVLSHHIRLRPSGASLYQYIHCSSSLAPVKL